MTLAREVVDELLHRIHGSHPVQHRVVRPTVTRKDIETRFVHRVRPVVHRVRRLRTVQPVVQPLTDEDDLYDLPPVTQQRVVPLERREHVADWSEATARKMRAVEQQVAELTNGHESEVHLRDVDLPDEVHEIVIDEVVQDIQPVRKQRVRRATVVEEVRPVLETVTETTGVRDVEWRDAVPYSQWAQTTPEEGDDEDAA